MNPNTIRGMAPHIRVRFHFATSSFSRMYGVNHVTLDMIDFCYDWAHTTEQAPLDCLNHVDRYFRQLWDTSHAGHQRRQLHQDFFVTFQWLCLFWVSGQSTNTTGSTGNRLTRGTRSSIITSVETTQLRQSPLVGSGLAAKGTYSTECSSVWIEYSFWVRVAGGSNPLTPIASFPTGTLTI